MVGGGGGGEYWAYRVVAMRCVSSGPFTLAGLALILITVGDPLSSTDASVTD